MTSCGHDMKYICCVCNIKLCNQCLSSHSGHSYKLLRNIKEEVQEVKKAYTNLEETLEHLLLLDSTNVLFLSLAHILTSLKIFLRDRKALILGGILKK